MWGKKVKYGAKSSQAVHWAMWAKKFKYGALVQLAQCTTWGLFAPYLNFLAHLAQCTTWGLFAPYLSFLPHIAQCTIWGRFAPYLNFLGSQRVLRWYIGQVELRSLNMVQIVLRWYIGQGELRSLKYGAKSPQMVHWARWAKKFAPHLNFLAHIAQCTIWGLFAPYFKLLSSPCPMYHLSSLCTIF
jgi:hypothetical protein